MTDESQPDGVEDPKPDQDEQALAGTGNEEQDDLDTARELETIVRQNLPITLAVVSNSVFDWIKAGQKSGYEERYYSDDFTQSDHARIAEAYGVKSWRIEDPAELAGALRAAVETPDPALIDIISQPPQEARPPVCEWVA